MTTISRRDLFEKVWAQPVANVAAELGLTDAAVRKMCDQHDIPVPSRGYWERVAAGKTYPRPHLRPAKDASRESITFVEAFSPLVKVRPIAITQTIASRDSSPIPPQRVLTKKPASKRRTATVLPKSRVLPKFKHVTWYDGQEPNDYLTPILLQMGRYGIERKGYGDNCLTESQSKVLTELLRWQNEMPGQPYEQLTDWRYLNWEVLRERALANPRKEARPRIVVTAEITSKDNLTVRWYPKGYLEAGGGYGYGNLLKTCDTDEPLDFTYFSGDETGAFAPRPSNELMFIRDVGNLYFHTRPLGPYAPFDHNSLTALLVCAVRAAFNQVITGLRHTFDVTLFDDFEFDFVEEADPDGWREGQTRKVVSGWRLIDARPSA